MAQVSLPTGWDASGAPPAGWSVSGTANYTSSAYCGTASPSIKLDNTGDFVMVNFADNPGTLTYKMRGASLAGATFAFTVQESVNGTVWTTLRAFTQADLTSINTAMASFTDMPLQASRYIRWFYTLKSAGNIALDDMNLTIGAAGPAQEINVQVAAVNYPSNATYYASSPVSTPSTINFTIQNVGTTNTLNIASAVVSGLNAGDFVVGTVPSTVAAASSAALVVTFTPSMAGTRIADLTINSDDADEGSYVIHFYGVGGSFATTPIYQPTGLTFTNIKSYRFNASFNNAFGMPDGYLVLRKKGSPITDVPTDGTAYQRGDVIGGSSVLYSGSATAFAPTYIVANTQYYFAIFSYNGPGIYRSYLTAAPLTGNVTTAATMMPANTYNTVHTGVSTFVADLHNVVYPHTHMYYSDYDDNVVNLFASRDTTNDQRVVTCVYSGENKVYTAPFDWTITGFSREHSYCNQWMPAGTLTTDEWYEDYHQLFPVDQNNANAVRSNYPLGKVVNVSYTYLGCKLGTDALGHTVFEPRDSDKGDAARAIMYEAICYTTIAGNNWGLPNPISVTIPYGEDQNILKLWNIQDPPDAWEISRNDFIDSVQGNRNPFVDSSHYACYIDFTNMSYIATNSCNGLGIKENTNTDLISIAPNPNNGNFMIYYSSAKFQKVTMKLMDVMGRVVYANETKVNTGGNPIEMNLQNVSKGIYSLEFVTESGKQTQKLIIQ